MKTKKRIIKGAKAKKAMCDAAENEEIIALVERYLEPHQPKNNRLKVIGVRYDGEYFWVVVRPVRDDMQAYDHYTRLAEAAGDIDEHENVNVVLVPTLPG